MTYTRQQFITKVAPMAQSDSKKSKILASLTLAQAILESADGNSMLTRQGNALFGIKAANWKGKIWTGSTIEYYDGKTKTPINAGFRAYDSWQESIADHSKLITGYSRYKAIVGEKDYEKACKAIQAAGYATDPNYAIKLIGLIKVNGLYKFDNLMEGDKELSGAVSNIIKRGIDIDFNLWKRLDLIKLANVPILVCKLAGIKINGIVTECQYRQAIDKLVLKQAISQRAIWDNKTYTENNVRALLTKYSELGQGKT